MRILQIVVAFLLLPFSAVLANPQSFPAELVFFYWAYKIQNAAKLPLKQVVGGQCGDGNRGCNFAQFVKWVTGTQFENAFKGKPPTFKPGDSQVNQLEKFITAQNLDPSYDLDRLYGGQVRMAPVFQLAVQNIAAAARQTDPGVSLEDIKTVRTFATKILGVRRFAEITYKVTRMAIRDALGADIFDKYIKSGDEKWFDWDATISAITDAENAKQLSSDKARSVKQTLQRLSKSIPSQPGNGNTRAHFAIMQRLSAGVTEMKNWAESTLRENPKAVKVDPTKVPASCLTERLRR